MSTNATDLDRARGAQQAQQARTAPLWLRRGQVLLAIMEQRGDYQQLAPLRAELAVVDNKLRALGEQP
jgi:hypothetical protein